MATECIYWDNSTKICGCRHCNAAAATDLLRGDLSKDVIAASVATGLLPTTLCLKSTDAM